MKRKLLLTILPVIALSACSSLGKEITQQEASEKSEAIYTKQSAVEEFSFSYTITTSIDGTKEVRKYKYILNQYGDYMISRDEKEEKSNGYRSTKTLYVFRPSKSEQVLYIKEFSSATNKTKITAQTRTGRIEEFEQALNKQSSFIQEAQNYQTSIVFGSINSQVGANYDEDTHYYSTGEGNLTSTFKFTYNGTESNSAIKEIKRTFKYSNDLFANYSSSLVTFSGQKKTETASSSYKNVNVSFPTDWSDHVDNSAAM